MEKVIATFSSHEDAERADLAYYASLTPDERVAIVLALMEQHRRSLGVHSDRIERVLRVVERQSD